MTPARLFSDETDWKMLGMAPVIMNDHCKTISVVGVPARPP